MKFGIGLLVSVRSAAEAEAALAGGAGLIDVQEPGRGSLGRADAETVAAVLRAVAGRRPVSAALGELTEGGASPSLPRSTALWHGLPTVPLPRPQVSEELPRTAEAQGDLRSGPAARSGDRATTGASVSPAYAKWGLAGCGGRPGWPDELGRAAELLPPGCRPVAVAYADWRRAVAPPPADICTFACARRWGAFLVDTWGKDGTTLLDWLSPDQLAELLARCRAAGVPVALAGSLGVEQLLRLRALRPDWFAVRGAACRDGLRTQAIDADRVRRLVDLLGDPVTAATPGS
jgi:uncharacterized protein (UPF0264 family)